MLKIKNSQLDRTVFTEQQLKADDVPKIIFVGRSNVGKSSFINKLLNRKNLARTSSKPGKTISINYFLINESIYFVDLPGYGYARIPKPEAERVKKLMTAFFESVTNAKLVILLLDCRRGFMESDLGFLEQVLAKKIKLLTVLTKSDKLKSTNLFNQKRDLQDKFGLNVMSFTIKSNEDAVEILKHINQALTE